MKSKADSALELLLPATSANLGPAFDAAALAFRLYLRVRAQAAPGFAIAAKGRDAEICGQIKSHLILTTYREILEEQGKRVTPLALRIQNKMPIGKGCGSSAAARLAGIAMAVHFGKLGWNDSQIIGEASRREHHPDNAAACWIGGLCVARMRGEREAQAVKIAPKGRWPLLFAVPDGTLSTEEARRVLPDQYSRDDAVSNVQNSMLLLAAFVQGRHELLACALEDKIHQPFRASLCPLLPAIQEMRGREGVLGVALSGAGPSVLIFLDPVYSAKKAEAAVGRHLSKHGLSAELFLTSIADKGAREQLSWRKAPGRSHH